MKGKTDGEKPLSWSTTIITIITAIALERQACIDARISTCHPKERLLDYLLEVCSIYDSGVRKKGLKNGPKRTKWHLDGHAREISDDEELSDLNGMLKSTACKTNGI